MPSSQPIKYLVFSGGGAAFPAFAGAISQLSQEPDFSFYGLHGVLGTSSGALTALLVSLCYSPDEILLKLSSINLLSFKHRPDITRLFRTYGIYKTSAIYQLILQIIQEKTKREDPENVTFNDLKLMGFLDLYVVTTKFYELNDNPIGEMIVFSNENFADTSVATAVLTSVSASPYFEAIWLKKLSSTQYVIANKKDKSAELFTDGGLCDNYAITYFDSPQYVSHADDPRITKIFNPQVLGISLVTKEQLIDQEYQPTRKNIPANNIQKFTEALVNTLLIDYQYQHLHEPGTGERTIEVDRLSVQAFDFNISRLKIQALIDSGKKAVRHYFATREHDEKLSLEFKDENGVAQQKSAYKR